MRKLAKLLGHLTSTIQAGTSPVPAMAKCEKESFRTLSHLLMLDHTFPSSERGVGLVKWQSGSLEQENFGFGFPRYGKRDRRLSTERPEPHSKKVDTFLQDYGLVRGYTFSPFPLIGRYFSKLLDERVSYLVLVAPVWQSQPWYPPLLE